MSHIEYTEKQLELLNEVKSFADRYRYCPTNADLAERFNVNQNSIFERLMALKKHGLVDWVHRSSRTLHVTDKGESVLKLCNQNSI